MFNLIGKALAQNALPTIARIDTANFGDVIGGIINVALYVGGGIAVLYLIYGGIMYVTAGAEQEKATSARTIIVNAIIGVVIIALAMILMSWVTGAIEPVTGGSTQSF